MATTESNKAWYIFYTCPRAEKKALSLLLSDGFETYLPLRCVTKIWKNRQKKTIHEPLFPGYIFVRTQPENIYRVLQNPKIARCITCDKKPSTLSTEEIQLIQKTLDSGEDLLIRTELPQGEKVQLIYGPLMGYEGILIKQKGKNRVGIQIDGLPYAISIEVSIDHIRLK